MSPITNTWRKRLSTGGLLTRRTALALLIGSSSINGLHIAWKAVFPDPPLPVAAIAHTVDSQADLAKAFAIDCVTRYLTSSAVDTQNLGQCFPRPEKFTLPTTPAVIVSNAGAYANPWGPSLPHVTTYAVVVGVTEQAYATAPRVRNYFQLSVVVYDHAAPMALDNLTPIGAPPTGVKIELNYPVSIPSNAPLFTMLSGFASCYLTNSAGLERFVTTDSGLQALHRYAAATLTTVTAASNPVDNPPDNTELQVRLEVSTHDEQYTPGDWSIAVTLRASGGAWFVSGIDPVPEMSTHSTASPAAPTAAAQPN